MVSVESESELYLTPTDIQIWLEWAGARLVSMPDRRPGPGKPRVIWPDFSQDLFEVLEFRGEFTTRPAIPSAKEITLMEEILTLPNLCKRPAIRKTVRIRTLINPINDRHVFSWRKVAKAIGSDVKTVRVWYNAGLLEIFNTIPEVTVNNLALRMRDI